MDGSFLVTGAAQGFGREFTRRVLLAGGTVLLSDINPEGGLATTKEFQEEFGTDRCAFHAADVSSKADWEALWSRAEQFFGGKVDVLVNNAGVSPLVCNFDTVMKVNLEGVLHGANMMAERQSTELGGAGGLVVNTASLAGLTLGMDRKSISYQISKHGVVALTRSFGGPKVANKTGIKHVALCPWFAETGIMEGVDKERLKKAVMFDFVTVERVGEAFEQVVRDQHSGSLMMIMSGCPLTYYPDITNALFMLTVLLSRVSGLLGAGVVSSKALLLLLCLLVLLSGYLGHLALNYVGL